MSDILRKGWCPGALRPMAAKDGLLVRLRITGGILSAAMAHELADLAMCHGNGLFDLSARGNLQIRGVTDASLGALQDGLRRLGLLDADAAGESIRNVIASPLAGLRDGPDVRPLTRDLELRLTRDVTLHALPQKFGFLIDDGSAPSLAAIAADIRFDWLAEAGSFSIGLAGTRDDAVRIGICNADKLVDRAGSNAHGALKVLSRCTGARRLRDAVNMLGADAVAQACDGRLDEALRPRLESHAIDVVGWRTFESEWANRGRIACLGLAAPFGRLDAPMLHAAAALAATTPLSELRLTPWRMLLVPQVTADVASPDTFITDPTDPRLVIAACVGVDGCDRGTTSTHADAARFAKSLPAPVAPGIVLHVSGCAKGCANPSASSITMVARDGRYDLVRDGRAADAPCLRGLDPTRAHDVILEHA